MSCLFCDLAENYNAHDFRSSRFWARLDVHPVSPGHVLIISNRHVAGLTDLNGEEWTELRRVRAQALDYLDSLGADGLRKKYQELLEARLTRTSPWFIERMLNHPRFGTTPDGYNEGVNLGQAAGQTVMHLHWHIIPRYASDILNPKGGVRYVIPELGNYTEAR